MKLGIDLDGVVIDSISTLLEIWNFENKSNYKPEDITKYDLSCIGIKDIASYFQNHPEIYIYSKPYNDALDYLQKLYESGNKIYFITSRRDHELTEKWLDKHNINYNALLTKTDGLKGIISKCLDLDIFIDDYHKNLDDIVDFNKNIQVYLFDRPWNKKIKNYERVYSWNEFYEKVEKYKLNKLIYERFLGQKI